MDRAQKAEYMKAWRAENREHVDEYTKRYRTNNPEYREKKLKADRLYYEKVVKQDPEKVAQLNAYTKARDAANPEGAAARVRRYREGHRELLREKAKADYHRKSPK